MRKVDLNSDREVIGYMPFFFNPFNPTLRDIVEIEDMEGYDSTMPKYFSIPTASFPKYCYYYLSVFTLSKLAEIDVNLFNSVEIDVDKINDLITRLGKTVVPDIMVLENLFSVANYDLNGVLETFPKLLLKYAHLTPKNLGMNSIEDESILAAFFFSFMIIMKQT